MGGEDCLFFKINYVQAVSIPVGGPMAKRKNIITKASIRSRCGAWPEVECLTLCLDVHPLRRKRRSWRTGNKSKYGYVGPGNNFSLY